MELDGECLYSPRKRVLMLKPRSYKVDLGSLARQVAVAQAPSNIVHTVLIAAVRGMGAKIKIRGGQRARRTCLTIAVDVRRLGGTPTCAASAEITVPPTRLTPLALKEAQNDQRQCYR
ncbi:hypothetical protein BGZ75_007959 [Mortierella antarctica]|nr:hypothetical protein BGZ75_007959 [Mortierella antarctica]